MLHEKTKRREKEEGDKNKLDDMRKLITPMGGGGFGANPFVSVDCINIQWITAGLH